MSTKILDFTSRHPLALLLAEQVKEQDKLIQRRRHKALSDVRVLVETVYDLLDDPCDEFTQQLLERLLPRVVEALDEGGLF